MFVRTEHRAAVLIMASLGLALAGCGGGTDGPSLSGTVVGSYFRNALVCVDSNNNGVCDPTESRTRSDATGKFTLVNVQGGGGVVAEIGTDATRFEPDTGTTTPVTDKIVFRAPEGNTAVVSALSTLVANEMDRGASLSQALATVASRVGVSQSKLLTDYNTETDPLTKNMLLAQANNTMETIKAVVKFPGSDFKASLVNATLDRNRDPKVLYVWTQIAANDTSPFTKVSITGSSSTIALNANPVGRVPDSTTYTVSDTSAGNPLAVGGIYARAITTGANCPQIVIDGTSRTMSTRAPAVTSVDTSGQNSTGSKTVAVKADFNALTCEARIADGTRAAIINGQGLKIPGSTTTLNRVIVIGDSGCRIKGPNAFGSPTNAGDPVQDCTDDRAWPYKRIAAAAASFNPDLIIHNGDIHYREGVPIGVENPPGVAGTTRNEDFLQQKGLTSSITYGWAAWDADFFKPSGQLLSVAPWAITRGNHESCWRAGTGWFHFLDPRPFPANEPKWSATYDPATCNDAIDPVVTTFNDLQVVLMDNSFHQSTPGANGNTQGWTHGDHIRTARHLNAVSALSGSGDAGKVTWIVTHKPLVTYSGGAGNATKNTWQYQKAIASSGVAGVETFLGGNGKLPGNAQMLHAGHVHGWQMLSFPASTNMPTMFLNGVAGDTLEAGFMIDTTTGGALAPANFGNNITSGAWPWLGANAALFYGSLSTLLPDAFSSSPIVGAGTSNARITEFGFVVYDRIPGSTNWKSTFYDMDRTKLRTCTTIGKRTTCDG